MTVTLLVIRYPDSRAISIVVGLYAWAYLGGLAPEPPLGVENFFVALIFNVKKCL